MNSSNPEKSEKFLDFLNENDFVEAEKKRKIQLAKMKAVEQEQRRIDAMPKITDDHLRKADLAGYERGVQEGLRQGAEIANKNNEQHFATLIEKIEDLRPQLKKIQAINQKQAILMCEQVLKTLSESFAEKYPREVLQQCIQRTFYYAPMDAALQVRLNPTSRFQLEKIENNPMLSAENKSRITFIEDDTIDVGDCAIEWDESGIDARFKEASQALQKLLLSVAQGINPSTVDLPNLEGENRNNNDTENDTVPEELPTEAKNTPVSDTTVKAEESEVSDPSTTA